MTQKLSIERVEDIAVLRLSNPPRNFLGPILRDQLSKALQAVAADPSVSGVLLTGSDGVFSTGFNVASAEMREGKPSLSELCSQIEAMDKPVVAVLFGAALGGGLELALAAHGRVALATTLIGMPDISVGLIPFAGGTQRLPRLLGADRSLAVMLSGQSLPASHPRLEGLLDEIVPEKAETAGLQLLKRLIASKEPLARTSERDEGLGDPVAYQAAIRACREAMGDSALLVENSLVDCVERALLLPFEAGLAFEEEAFIDCAASDQASGLLNVQLAQRRAPNMPEAIAAQPHIVSRLGVVGGGATSATLVEGALKAGILVWWFERSDEATALARARLEKIFETVQIDPETRRACLAQLTMTLDLRDLAQADVVIEAVADNPRTKAQLFSALGKVVSKDTILVTHTPTQPIANIAEAAAHPHQVVGLYAPPAAARARLAELIPGPQSADKAVVTVAELLRRIGVLPIRAGGGGGTIGLRMVSALRDAADVILDLGGSPDQIDAALSAWGIRGGVFMAMDAGGLEPMVRRVAQLHHREDHSMRHLERVRKLIASGRTGRADGAGFYDWVEGKAHPRDPRGDGPSQDEIVHLCLGAMMNEGARLLREGVALRPSDIDLVMIRHYGFPAWRGGPMHAADRVGLFTLVRAMKPHEADAPRLFGPDAGVADLIKNGENFEVLNAVGRNRRRIRG